MNERNIKSLVIEDDPKDMELVCTILKRHNCTIETAKDGDEGLKMLKVGGYELAVVDYQLPGKHGMSVISEARAANVTTRCVMLTSIKVPDDVPGDRLRNGADEHLYKGDSYLLESKLIAILRTIRGGDSNLSWGDYVYDAKNLRILKREGGELQPIKLLLCEIRLMHYLMNAPDLPLTRDFLVDNVMEWEDQPPKDIINNLRNRILFLRRKLGMTIEGEGIVYKKGEGYVLV